MEQWGQNKKPGCSMTKWDDEAKATKKKN